MTLYKKHDMKTNQDKKRGFWDLLIGVMTFTMINPWMDLIFSVDDVRSALLLIMFPIGNIVISTYFLHSYFK